VSRVAGLALVTEVCVDRVIPRLQTSGRGHDKKALALDEASVRRRRLRQDKADGQSHPPDFTVEIVKHIDAEPGFKLLPRHWVVEVLFCFLCVTRNSACPYSDCIILLNDLAILQVHYN